MNNIVLFRQFIDASCFIVGRLSDLHLSDKAQLQVIDILTHVCTRADELCRKEIDKVFLPKDSE